MTELSMAITFKDRTEYEDVTRILAEMIEEMLEKHQLAYVSTLATVLKALLGSVDLVEAKP